MWSLLMCACVCVCVCARVHVCTFVCMRLCVCVCVCHSVCVRVRTHVRMHAIYAHTQCTTKGYVLAKTKVLVVADWPLLLLNSLWAKHHTNQNNTHHNKTSHIEAILKLSPPLHLHGNIRWFVVRNTHATMTTNKSNYITPTPRLRQINRMKLTLNLKSPTRGVLLWAVTSCRSPDPVAVMRVFSVTGFQANETSTSLPVGDEEKHNDSGATQLNKLQGESFLNNRAQKLLAVPMLCCRYTPACWIKYRTAGNFQRLKFSKIKFFGFIISKS